MSETEALERLLRNRSVVLGSFVLASGQPSTYYIDARKTTMSAEGLRLIGQLGLRAIRRAGWDPDAVGGLTMGADPVAYAVALASLSDLPIVDAFSVRKATKEHGTQQRIEGNFRPGARVVVVEDVLTTGGSTLQAIEAVVAGGGQVLGVLAVVDREQGGREGVEARGHKVIVVTTTTRLGLESPA